MAIIRNDVMSWGKAPREVQRALRECGGLNPFKEPNFRLVISEATLKLRGGAWYKWPEKSSLQSRGGLIVDEQGQRVRPPNTKPERVVADIRWVRKYPQIDGWILEEWYPAHMFGSPESWASHKVPEAPSLPVLAGYPTYGLYMLAYPCGLKEVPPLDYLRRAVRYCEYARSYWQQFTPLQRQVMWEREDLQQMELKKKWQRDRDLALIRDTMSPLWSLTLEAGRWREELAKSAGLRSHVGN